MEVSPTSLLSHSPFSQFSGNTVSGCIEDNKTTNSIKRFFHEELDFGIGVVRLHRACEVHQTLRSLDALDRLGLSGLTIFSVACNCEISTVFSVTCTCGACTTNTTGTSTTWSATRNCGITVVFSTTCIWDGLWVLNGFLNDLNCGSSTVCFTTHTRETCLCATTGTSIACVNWQTSAVPKLKGLKYSGPSGTERSRRFSQRHTTVGSQLPSQMSGCPRPSGSPGSHQFVQESATVVSVFSTTCTCGTSGCLVIWLIFSLTTSLFLCTVSWMIVGISASTALTTCWTCVFATCCVFWMASISTIFSTSEIAGLDVLLHGTLLNSIQWGFGLGLKSLALLYPARQPVTHRRPRSVHMSSEQFAPEEQQRLPRQFPPHSKEWAHPRCALPCADDQAPPPCWKYTVKMWCLDGYVHFDEDSMTWATTCVMDEWTVRTSLRQMYNYWQECTCRGREVSGLKILSLLSTKQKNTKKREVQWMCCGRDQWQHNTHGRNSLYCVTTRSKSRESSTARAIFNGCGFQEITTKWDLDKNIFVRNAIFVEKDVMQNNKKGKGIF